ncbi:thioesterase-like superfamily-domain-containing protein [Zychaea mexicana]|uniref:thioesterase-like superfamily-domain-containing protein n=1 Tax=Zychaea mexicana TaxID=64656 RepID=UPI0022FE6EF3|nr:thioesterase-like superfamily-domain-containing protein [Zychaea mexicana]KAI9496759.1 thioesterase-like superfamily-domain-containing protein [Zychaea mexicana]
MSTAEATQGTVSAFDEGTNTVCIGTTESGATLYVGNASKKWAIGDVPHTLKENPAFSLSYKKGYVIALVTDAALRHFENKHQHDPVALNCFYMHKTSLGPFVVSIKNLKTSKKGYCLVQASLLQAEGAPLLTRADQFQPDRYKEKVHVVFTMGNLDSEEGINFMHEPYQAPNRAAMTPFKHIYMGEYLECLADRSTFGKDHLSMGKPEFHQSLQFKDGRDIDFKSIPYFCDLFVTPPMLLGWDYLGGPVWCPTMQLEVLFKRRPSGKEILSSIVAPHIINGRFDCSGGIWDPQGNLIALTRHQCLVVPWSRNSKGEKPRPRF